MTDRQSVTESQRPNGAESQAGKYVDFKIEVVKTVWEWVCEEVVLRIIHWVRIAVRYIFWVLRWVCWLVDWPIRFIFRILPCLLGANHTVRIPVCVKVLVDENGTVCVTDFGLAKNSVGSSGVYFG